MKKILVPYLQTLLFAIFANAVIAAVIPADRKIDWSQSGIPGGIPNRTSIFCDVTQSPYNAKGDDSTDNRAALQAAFNACPSGKVVYIPAGIYRVNGTLNVPSNITIRGAGTANTTIKSVGRGAGLFIFGSSGVQWNPASVTTTISSGSTAGSTSFSVASSSGISVGTYLVVTETNNSAVKISTANGTASWVDAWSTNGTRARGQIVEVTGVSGNTVNFTPALYTDYTLTPWATRFTAGCKNSGVENLTIYATNSGTERNFLFQTAAYCWVYNVFCDFTDGDQVTLDWSYRCEVRKSYFKDAFVHTSGSYDNMIGLRSKTTACLIVDNIVERLHVGIMCEWGAAGNVIAYNYVFGEYDDATANGNRWMPVSLLANHGAHPQFNLFEGNVAQKFISDSYWGSASHTTAYRNWILGKATTYPPYSARGTPGAVVTLNQDNKCIDLWEAQTKFSIVGNILGDPTLTGYSYKIVNPASRSYTGKYIWSFGYCTTGDSGGTASLENPSLTIVDHGNYDYVNKGVQWSSGLDQTLPSSLFLASKPAWFGDRPWPAFDSSNPGGAAITNIPAGYRRLNNGMDPPGMGAIQPPSNARIEIQ